MKPGGGLAGECRDRPLPSCRYASRPLRRALLAVSPRTPRSARPCAREGRSEWRRRRRWTPGRTSICRRCGEPCRQELLQETRRRRCPERGPISWRTSMLEALDNKRLAVRKSFPSQPSRAAFLAAAVIVVGSGAPRGTSQVPPTHGTASRASHSAAFSCLMPPVGQKRQRGKGEESALRAGI